VSPKVDQFFRYGDPREWRRCNHKSFTCTGQCPTYTSRSVIIIPTHPLGTWTPGLRISIIDQCLGSSSASDNAFFPTHFAFFPHTLRFPVTRHLSSAQTLATLVLASHSNPLPLTNPSFHLPLGGLSAYVLCSL
jgi:hypothetical protein